MRTLSPIASLLSAGIAALLVGIVAPCVGVQAQIPSSAPTPTPPSISPAMPAMATPPADATKPGCPEDGASYVLGAGDQISVSIWGEPQFDATYTISPDGKISMKLIGEIQAAGLTRPQLEAAIEQAALKELRRPRCSVNLLASHSKHIYFDGDGVGSGAMDMVMPIHLLEALSTHGCCRDFAKIAKIQVRRDGKLLTHDDGGKKSQYFNYKDIFSGKQANPLLLDGDHIIVP
jgi:polysaccharide biosynthesis/export protein